METKHYVMPDGVAFKTIEDLMEYYDIDLSSLEFKEDNVAVVVEAAKHVVDMWGVTEEDLMDGDLTDEERLMIKVAFGSEMNLDERNNWDTYISMMDGRLSITEDRYVSTTKRAVNAGWVIVVIGIIFSILLFICGVIKYNEETFVCKYPVPETSLDLRQGQRVTGAMLNTENKYIYGANYCPMFYFTGEEYLMWGITRLTGIPEESAKDSVLSKELFDKYFKYNEKWELIIDSEFISDDRTCYDKQATFENTKFYIVYPVRLSTTDELYGFVIYPED